MTWLFNLGKITSTAHKNNILLTCHGAIYTRERRYRYGLSETPTCPRCEEIETIKHKVFECNYANRIWNETLKITNKLSPNIEQEPDRIKQVLGAVRGTSPLLITIHAGTLTTIIRLKEDQSYLQHPRNLVQTLL